MNSKNKIQKNLYQSRENKTFLDLDMSTDLFIEEVLNSINKIKNNSNCQVLNLTYLKSRLHKTNNNNPTEILEVIEIDDQENKINNSKTIVNLDQVENVDSDPNEDVMIISQEEFERNIYSKLVDSENKEGNNNNDDFSCLICLRTKILVNTRQFDCGHEFCNKCANRWMKMKNTCPICRKEIYKW